MAEFNEIKFKGQLQDYQTLKAGLKRSDLDGNSKLQSIFDKIDTANANGVKDGVLDENEINNFMQKIVEFAKGGRDKKLSSKEADNLLQSLGVQNADASNLFALLNSFSTQSKNIKQTVANTQNNSNITEYTDGHTEEVFADGSKIITVKNGDTKTITKQDKNGNIISKIETTVKDGVETVVEYEGETPKSKTVTDNNNNTVSSYIFENGEETLVQETNTQTGDVTTYQDGTKTITKKDGTTIIEADGVITTTSADGNTQTVQDTTTGAKKTEVFNPETNTKTESYTDAEGNQTVLVSKDGKNISQNITKDGQSYSVEYDGIGNTKGIVVQNGESPASIAEKFGCSVEDLIAANPDVIKGKAPNQYFLAGADIVIPGEMNAETFAKLNAGRQSKEQAAAEYAQYERTVTDARLATKQTKEITVEKDYANWTEYAKEMLKNEGIENPTAQQIADRTNELTALNPDTQIPARGTKITVTKTNQEISDEAEQQKQINETKQKQATDLANKFYQIADDNSGLNSMKKMQAMFDNKEINADNIVAVLDAYDDQGAKQGDSSIIDTITSEIGAGGTNAQRDVLMSVMNTLCEAAVKEGVSQEDITFAKNQFETSLNKEFDAVLRRTNPMEMENAIRFLKGAILAKQNEAENVDTQQAMTEMAQGFKTENDNANAEFETARKEEGWAASVGDTVCGWFGCNTIEDLRAKLGNNSKNIEALIQAAESNDETKFREIYKQTFGVEFDANKIAAREEAENKLMQASGTKAALELFSGIDSNMSYDDILTKLSDTYDQETIDQIISGYSKGYRMPASSDDDKKAILLKFVGDSTAKLQSDYQQLTNGKTLEQMETDLDTLTKSAYGTNDIGKAVAQFNENQKTTEMVTEVAAEIAVTTALMAVPGGQALAAAKIAASAARWGSKGFKVAKYANKALKMAKSMQNVQKGNVLKNSTSIGSKVLNKGAATGFNMAATGTATVGVDLSNGKSVREATEKALMNMSFAGVGSASSQLAPKLMQTFKINSTLANEVAEEIINAAGSYGITKLEGDEYGSTDAFVDFASGLIISRISHVKGGTKTEPASVSADPQQVRVSKGVKGDFNNNRDVITDGEIAQNADQSHLNANGSKMVEQGLEDVPTQAEVNAYQKEHGYESVPDADKPAFEAHQKKAAEDYDNAHKIENNAVISEQKTPSAPKEVIDKLNDEIKGLDGSIKKLEQQIAGAKLFGKNTDKLEQQLTALKEKRAAKAAEFEAAKNPVKVESELKADTPIDETSNAEVKQEVQNEPAEVKETPANKSAAEVETEVTPESIKKSVNDISDAEIPVEHKDLWQNCKKQIDTITNELKDFKGDINAMLSTCEKLFADLKTIAKNASQAVKNKIEKLINDMKSMLPSKNLQGAGKNITQSVTPQHQMQMGQIGQSINNVKNAGELDKLQKLLDEIPDCSKKSILQKQINDKKTKFKTPVNSQPHPVANSTPASFKDPGYPQLTTANGVQVLKHGQKYQVNLAKNQNTQISMGFGVTQLDINDKLFMEKFNALKEGESFTVGSWEGNADYKLGSMQTGVSREHFTVIKENGQMVILDKKSTNGTKVQANNPKPISTSEIKSYFNNDCINQKLLNDVNPNMYNMHLDDVDYQNMQKLMNVCNGKYINVWLGTCGTDGVRNIEKLAILEKVLRRNNVIDDYLKLGPNEWDLVCNTTCQKYKNAVDALYSYKKDSNPMNLYLSGLKDPVAMKIFEQNWGFLNKSELNSQINNLTAFLDKQRFNKKVWLHRGDSYSGVNYIKTKNGVPLGEAMEKLIAQKASPAEIKKFVAENLQGKSILQERFMSTTLTEDVATKWAKNDPYGKGENPNGAIRWNISAPAGTKGAHCEDFSPFDMAENEVLLQRNTSLDIIDAYFNYKENIWVINAVARQS